LKSSDFPSLKYRSDEAAALLFSMGHEHRLRVLIILSEGEATVKSLAEKVGLTQSALSQHLGRLRKAKLVKTRRDATKLYFSCTSPAVFRVLGTLDDIFKSASDERDKLGSVSEADSGKRIEEDR
jgi:DNA-binding transcriptional ArsR family regulator